MTQDYKEKLKQTQQRKEELLEDLKEYLYTNRGRRTTRESDQRIIRIAENLAIVGYNERFYEEKLKQ